MKVSSQIQIKLIWSLWVRGKGIQTNFDLFLLESNVAVLWWFKDFILMGIIMDTSFGDEFIYCI